MSGIAGIYYLDGRPVDRADLGRMVDTLAHRGPDGARVWVDGAVGLGHRMLHTTPESLHETLPLTSRCGNYTITADARIDNRDELISVLNLTDRPRVQISDSQIILAAYECWGDRCPEKLLGDFAFAIWDARKRQMFCARDHFGVKPFYYYQSDRLFIFATEIKAVLSLAEVPRYINEARIADYLVPMLEGIDTTSSFYQDVSRLSPARRLTIGCQELVQSVYWSLDPDYEIRYASDDEYGEAFRDIFTEAIRCRLRSAFPIGSMLSGGLDSSAIVCLARELLAQDGRDSLHTFSAVLSDKKACCESPFIETVLADGQLNPELISSGELSPFLADLEHVVEHADDPFDNIMFLPRVMYRAAKSRGVPILLDGIDGDLIMSLGDSYLNYYVYKGNWKALSREVVGLSKRQERSIWAILQHFVVWPLAPKQMQEAWRVLRGRPRYEWMANTMISPAFARRIGLAERLAIVEADAAPSRTAQEEHWRNLISNDVAVGLERYDSTAALCSIEPRHPLFDKRLVEFCFGLPAEQKIRNGWSKTILRNAMSGILPEPIRWRRDRGNIARHFIRSFVTYEQAFLDQVMLNPTENLYEYVDRSALQNTYQRYQATGAHKDTLNIWQAATLNAWLRREEVYSRRLAS